MTKEQSKRASGQYNLDDKGISYPEKLKGEINEYVLCAECQNSVHKNELFSTLCPACHNALLEKVENQRWDKKDEYSQCIACHEVIDNEFISEYGLCIECLRSELRALENKLDI